MRRAFPDSYRPDLRHEREQDGDGVFSNYTIGRQFAYMEVAWSKARAAAQEAEQLAKRHEVGLFDVSSGGEEVWLPSDGDLRLAHSKKLSFLERVRRKLEGI